MKVSILQSNFIHLHIHIGSVGISEDAVPLLRRKTSISQRQRNMAVVLILGVFYYYRTSHLLQINSTLTKEKQHSIIQRHAPPFGLHVHIGKIHKLLECSKVFLN